MNLFKHTFLLSFILFFSLLLKINSVSAQEKFQWYEGKCLFTGKVDSTKATYQELMNVYYTILHPNDFAKPFLAYAPKDTAFVSVENIKEEGTEKIKELKFLQYPKSEYWQKIRDAKIIELQALIDLRIITAKALKNPKVLKKTMYYPTNKEVCDALIHGGQKMYDFWKNWEAEQEKDAYSPDLMKENFKLMWNSPDKDLYARLELLRYVWYKNAASQIPYINVDYSVMQEFRALMSAVESNCH